MTQQHIIFGAGLIGGYLAGCFMNRGLNVALVGRNKTQAALANGLTVSDYLNHNAQLPSPTFTTQALAADILWLTVKCTAVEDSIAELSQFITPSTTIVCCQNGFGSDDKVRAAFPNNTVLTAIVEFNVSASTASHLHRSTQGNLVIEAHSAITPLGALLDCGLLPVQLSDDIESQRWAKLQLNLANAVNALADIPVKTMVEDAAYRKIIAALMTELLMVTDALEITLPKVTAVSAHLLPKLMRLPNWIFKLLAQKMLAIDPSARASMWWDLKDGRITEVKYLNAVVVQQGNACGISCPMNQGIVQLVQEIENGQEKIGFSAAALHVKLMQ